MSPSSIPTRGRTLDYAARVYDLLEPLLLLGRQAEYDRRLLELLAPEPSHRILDLGCGTGVLCAQLAKRLDPNVGGEAVGIDAAGKMVDLARRKRGGPGCRFEVMAAEALDFPDQSFDAVVSSLFFHHVDAELKARSLAEAWRVLRPGGKLVIADMHTPTTLFGAALSHGARWFFRQPEIGENIRGLLPELIAAAGFSPPQLQGMYFGYIALWTSVKP